MPQGYVFEEFPYEEREPDARRERLCPRAGGFFNEKKDIRCVLEGGRFAPPLAAPRDEIVVMAYNIERGFLIDLQVQRLRDDPEVPAPDILLLSEADRGCSRTGGRNTARDYARQLGMNYVFGVEFIELPRIAGKGRRVDRPCEHGNAILSRYPLGNARLIRFRNNRTRHSWLQRLLRIGEPRLGGRMALAADIKIGETYLHVYSLHLESGRRNERFRASQSAEVGDDGLRQPFGVLIGGDFNSSKYLSDRGQGKRHDRTVRELLERGYMDAHSAIGADERKTTRSGVAIDLIFGRRVRFVEAGIGRAERWDELSDHRPVWARLRLPES